MGVIKHIGPIVAQLIAEEDCRKRERISDLVIREYIIEKLVIGWIPEQIAGRIKMDIRGKSISHLEFNKSKQHLRHIHRRDMFPFKH